MPPALLLILTTLGIGCDALFGTEQAGGSDSIRSPRPQAAEFGFSPRSIFVEDARRSDGETVQFDVTVRIRTDAEGACASSAEALFVREGAADPVRARARLSFRPDSSGQVGGSDRPGCEHGLFRGTLSVRVPEGATGAYVVRTYLLGPEGRLGDRSEAIFRLRPGAGSPPVVESVTASADTIDGSDPPETLTFRAVASDPDGLANLPRRGPGGGVRIDAPDGSTFWMFDDGTHHGDKVAGDGTYTARFGPLEPGSISEGEQTFEFRAVDRTGRTSEIVSKTIVVE